jgi:hypothetical protein
MTKRHKLALDALKLAGIIEIKEFHATRGIF